MIDAALVLTSDHADLRGAVAVLGLVIGWGFIGTGLFAWARQPGQQPRLADGATGFAFLSPA